MSIPISQFIPPLQLLFTFRLLTALFILFRFYLCIQLGRQMLTPFTPELELHDAVL